MGNHLLHYVCHPNKCDLKKTLFQIENSAKKGLLLFGLILFDSWVIFFVGLKIDLTSHRQAVAALAFYATF